jgi:YesN/AraC family two-component response regulator
MDLELHATPTVRGPSALSARDPVISAIRSHVERNCAHATLKSAAAVVHMNPQYVSRLYKERTGENFHTMVARVRMEKAAQLLRDGGYLAYEVSEIVGYGNQKNFTRAFKRHFGVSPRRFRQSM